MIAQTFDALARRPLWLVWKTVARGGKPTKVPFTVDGRKASSTDATTWTTLAKAERAAPRYDGVGIVLAPLDESHHLGGVDLDACIDDEGNVEKWAREIVERLASYTEVSPSGHGLKVFFTYDPRATAPRRWRKSAKRPAKADGGKDPGIEFYLKGRYFTVTGSLFESFERRRHVSLEALVDIQQRMDAFAPKPRASEKMQAPGARTDDHDLALQCLAHIPNDGSFVARDAWLEIGMALHDATGGSAAGQLAWASWTAQQHANAQEACAATWSSFKTGGGFTLGTLVELARRHGFDPYLRGDSPRMERKSQGQGTTANGHTQGQRADGGVLWGEIDESLLEGARGTVPAFLTEVLPAAWRAWAQDAAESAGAPIDYIVQGLVSAVAAVSAAGVMAEVHPAWREPLILWNAAVGAPSSGKSPALMATRRLLDLIEDERRAGDAERKRVHDTQAAQAKAVLAKWAEECKAAVKKGKAVPQKPAEAVFETAFIPSQIVVSDTTIEALADVVSGNPKGVLLRRDELAAWLGNLGRYANGGSDRAQFLEAWAAAPVTINRRSRPEPLILKKFPVSIVGGIQPDRLAEAIEGADDGMAARFLYTWPDMAPYRSLANRRAPNDADALARLQRIASAAGTVDHPRILPLSEDASRQLDGFMERLHGQADGLEGLEASWVGKGNGTVVRLAAVLELLAWSEEDPPGPLNAIGSDAMHNAIALWDDYFRPHAIAVFNRAGQSDRDRLARRVIRWMRQTRAAEISVKNVRREALGHAVNEEGATEIIARLIKGNVLQAKPPAVTGGRPLVRWIVNPALNGGPGRA